MLIKKSVVKHDSKYQKLLILITILLFVAACSDPEAPNEKGPFPVRFLFLKQLTRTRQLI